jgi:hypothetical protein
VSGELPEPIRQALKQEERTARALERAVAPFPAPEPEPENRLRAFTRRMAEQRREEEVRAARVNRLMHENPSPDVDDPLRELARGQRAGRRRRRV